MSVDEKRRQYLKAMGIPVWETRDDRFANFEIESPESLQSESTPVPVDTPEVVKSPINWQSLQRDVASCTACDLNQTRTNTVFGVGNSHADLLVIGEAPGADEDRQGEPFVGRAGKLLNEMLLAIGFKREEVFIANILKCRPPNNRDPRPEEVNKCRSFLQKQIEFIQPKLILSVGRISAQNLLQTDEKIGRLRGKIHSFGEQQIPLVATYHPAYLLRSPLEKRKSWNDLLLALNTLRGEIH